MRYLKEILPQSSEDPARKRNHIIESALYAHTSLETSQHQISTLNHRATVHIVRSRIVVIIPSIPSVAASTNFFDPEYQPYLRYESLSRWTRRLKARVLQESLVLHMIKVS